MRIVVFCHSLVSDWNHGNAHFLRGLTSELQSRGHAVEVFEPAGGWSRTKLLEKEGPGAEERFRSAFPTLRSTEYGEDELDLNDVLTGVDLVLVHEWTDASIIRRIGDYRKTHRDVRVFFHDTHHRAVSAPHQMAAIDLSGYDGVLAFGRAIRDIYLARGWIRCAWVWHEAADIRTFRPLPEPGHRRDLVWIGNWGDDERGRELVEYLLEPARALELTGTVHGVRWPDDARRQVTDSGLEYAGWIANHDVPRAFAAHRVTVHVPRGPYARALPGIPTIRMFEALACGIPLVSAPWDDAEHLFSPGDDYLLAQDGEEMTAHLKNVLHDDEVAQKLRERGRSTILERHTCAHRVDELLAIYGEVA